MQVFLPLLSPHLGPHVLHKEDVVPMLFGPLRDMLSRLSGASLSPSVMEQSDRLEQMGIALAMGELLCCRQLTQFSLL